MGKIGDFGKPTKGVMRTPAVEKAALSATKLEKAAQGLISAIVSLITEDSNRVISWSQGADDIVRLMINGKPCITEKIKSGIMRLRNCSKIDQRCVDYLVKNVQNKPWIHAIVETEVIELLQLSPAEVKTETGWIIRRSAKDIIALSRFNEREFCEIIYHYVQRSTDNKVVKNMSIGEFIQRAIPDDRLPEIEIPAETPRKPNIRKWVITKETGAPKAGEEVKAAEGVVARKLRGLKEKGKAVKGLLQQLYERAGRFFVKLIRRAH